MQNKDLISAQNVNEAGWLFSCKTIKRIDETCYQSSRNDMAELDDTKGFVCYYSSEMTYIVLQ